MGPPRNTRSVSSFPTCGCYQKSLELGGRVPLGHPMILEPPLQFPNHIALQALPALLQWWGSHLGQGGRWYSWTVLSEKDFPFIYSVSHFYLPSIKISLSQALLDILGIEQWLKQDPCPHGVYSLVGRQIIKEENSSHSTCHSLSPDSQGLWCPKCNPRTGRFCSINGVRAELLYSED